MAKTDSETAQILTEADEIKNLTESRGWGIIKAKLDAKILDLQNISNIDENNLAIDLKARLLASRFLFAWLKEDVYGVIEQQEANSQALIEKSDAFVERHEAE
jgi:hypothetical protein